MHILKPYTSLILLFMLLLLQNNQTRSDLMVYRRLDDANYDLAPAPSSVSQEIDCDKACSFRCSKSSRPNLCKRACGTCCGRCGCVPSGTYGHYEECPCYGNITTRGGTRKCP